MVGEHEYARVCLVLSKMRGEHEPASDCLVLFVEMGYFDLDRQVFPWFFPKMVREHEEASVSLVLS